MDLLETRWHADRPAILDGAMVPPMDRLREEHGELAENLAAAGFTDDVTPDDYAGKAKEWVRLGARVVGGCCGTTPAHIRELARVFKGGENRGGD